MAFALRLGVLAAVAQIAQGGRVSHIDLLPPARNFTEGSSESGEGYKDELQVIRQHRDAAGHKASASETSLAEVEPGAFDLSKEVDFSFMTHDFSYPGHDDGWFGAVQGWFGGRSTSDDVKDELVQGHTCQKRGGREETYYAASLCYWLPDISISDTGPRGPLLAWKGGKYRNGKALCQGISGRGVCAKCSVCHNNAGGDSGDLEFVSFTEQLSLPDGCLREKEIESQCVSQFNGENKVLQEENTRCHEMQGRFEDASQALAQCTKALQRLPNTIEYELPQEIQRTQQDVFRKEAQLDQARHNEEDKRRWMRGQCNRYSSLSSGLYWQNMLLGATPTEQLLSSMSFHCSYPRRPIDNHDGSYWKEMARFQNNMELYNACNQCDNAKSDLKSANSRKVGAQSSVTRVKMSLSTLKQELFKAQQDLQAWRSKQPALAAAKQRVDDEWLPQQSACQDTFDQYTHGKSYHVAKCAPTFYDSSCEKACVEVQARHAGCGVMEGDRPGSIGGGGGIEATCAPPQPSWVLGPFTYGARELADAQCKRIGAAQRPQYAQRVLMSGWLWKKGRGLNGWDKRFFVLESSDQVRSAVLRYFRSEPAKVGDSDEAAGKGIILWDAKGLKVKKGTNYGFEDGEQCFKLYHFYRDFRLCVPSKEDNADPNQKPGVSVEEIRDEWMTLISDEMTHKQE